MNGYAIYIQWIRMAFGILSGRRKNERKKQQQQQQQHNTKIWKIKQNIRVSSRACIRFVYDTKNVKISFILTHSHIHIILKLKQYCVRNDECLSNSLIYLTNLPIFAHCQVKCVSTFLYI